ncbi:MAG TPA: rhamnan synthesis F family protein [Bacteroidia bacterium]|jgi:lipopolysaccharide biosynthesis protein|nr:rhamnan synthesis F family protein [Bacteroidia bacterium]
MDIENSKIGVILHIYYEDSFEFIKERLKVFKSFNTIFFFNICINAPGKEKLYANLKTTYPSSFITQTTNVGKDIGGKLTSLDLFIKLRIKLDYLVLLHDKKSPHSALGDVWKQKLFKIIEPSNLTTIVKAFREKQQVGILGAKEFIVNEYDKKTGFDNNNKDILKALIVKHQLKLNNFDFIGGTMFWIRAEIMQSFFSKYSALEVRSTLEKGNVLDNINGTYTHSWERMLCWIALDQGYLIKGI